MDPRKEHNQGPTARFARSTSGAAQRHRILDALRRGPKTSFELRRLGIYQHSVRIFELREAGYRIETARVNIIDHDGYEHRGCALYSQVDKPKPDAMEEEVTA